MPDRRPNYKLFAAVLLALLVPTLYRTYRIFLIGDIPNEWGYNIASQIAWLNIIYEVLQEGVTLPLFFVLGAVAKHHFVFWRKLRQGLMVIVPLYVAAAALIWFFSGALVALLSTPGEIVGDTISYIRWEALAIPMRVITDIAFIALITLADKRRIYFLLAMQLLVSICADYAFIGTGALNLGVLGVAYSSVTANTLTALLGFGLLHLAVGRAAPRAADEPGIEWKRWLNISVLSGAESGVRNFAFIVMILKLVNEVGESGVFWLTNGFIWGWLLLPVLALGSLIRQDVGTCRGVIGRRFRSYMTVTAVIVALWFITLPAWGAFIANVMGVDNSAPVVDLAMLMIVFYAVFAFNHLLDSYFYGMGRTDLMLYQSLLVNGVYYVGAFILYQAGIFVPNLTAIALLFGFGIVFDFAATAWLFRRAGYPQIVAYG
ncbi:MAG: MATE family Na+-driven efflux transporter [Gammaproteobacteria bacterium]